MLPIISAVVRLVVLAGVGFVVFRPQFMRRYALTPTVFITINFLFPIYFISSFGRNWHAAAEIHAVWLVAASVLCAGTIAFQAAFMKRLVGRTGGIPTDHSREIVTLGALHNAGYIPIPIMEALFSGPIMIYLFFYTLGFNIVFWTVAVGLVRGGERRFVYKPNAPTAGLVLGIVLAATGWYDGIPSTVQRLLHVAGDLGLDLVLVGLGGVLARISTQAGADRTRWSRYVLYRSLAYPAAVLLGLMLLPVGSLPATLAVALPIGLVLQASAPPSTNLMLVAEAYGTHEQVEVFGRGVIVSYLASAFAIPVFLALASLAFG